jgi:uncharacterized protein (TIGR02996 family)
MSGSLAKAFLDDIVANIDDDTPRLVYADWLEENDKPERAEFIRVQVERARLPKWDPAQVRLRLREQELLKKHAEEWLSEMPDIKGATWEGFRRGIVADVSFASFAAMRINAHACRAVAPVEAVTVHWPRKEGKKSVWQIAELRELTLTGRPWDEVAWLAASPQLSTLRILTTLGLSAGDMSQLVASPHLARLRALRLVSNGLGTTGVRALVEAATLTVLEELDLSGPGYYEQYYEDPIINTVGMETLAGWAGLAHVRSLTLSGSDVRPAGLRALLRSPHAGSLKELSLRAGRLDGQAMAEFVGARPDLRLDSLDLGENVLKQAGVDSLVSAACLSDLKVLRLDGCEIPVNGARQLVKGAPFLGGLRMLDVSHNHFGSVGLGALLERQPLALHTLWMRDDDLFDKGVELLAGSPASNKFIELDLSKNVLSAAATRALGESEHLRALLVLRLCENPIDEQAAAALEASPLGKRLAILELGKSPRRRSKNELPFSPSWQ